MALSEKIMRACCLFYRNITYKIKKFIAKAFQNHSRGIETKNETQLFVSQQLQQTLVNLARSVLDK
jgi:hypothetical protein